MERKKELNGGKKTHCGVFRAQGTCLVAANVVLPYALGEAVSAPQMP